MRKIIISILSGAFVASSLLFVGCEKGHLGDELGQTKSNSEKLAKDYFDTPTLTCGQSTQASLSITVRAGASGAPAGFSLQWMPKSVFDAGGGVWGNPLLCWGSFSGNANLSRYNLLPNESVTVRLGEFLSDNGASTNCPNALLCGTEYVFRAFVHANSTMKRSAFTGNLFCSTMPCGPVVQGCTYTQGYWKNHGPIPSGNNSNMWPVTSMMLGSINYTDLEMLAIFQTPANGNGLVALAHQLLAAKLNIANGSNGSAILSTIASADTLIGARITPPIGSGYLSPSSTSALINALADYNEGATGPGHCN